MEIKPNELAELIRAGNSNPQPPAHGSTVHPFEVGQNYFIRTVTHNHTGRLVAVFPTELVLEDAAWIADSGRWMDALEKGELGEVEPFPTGKVIIGRAAIIDATIFKHALPRSQK